MIPVTDTSKRTREEDINEEYTEDLLLINKRARTQYDKDNTLSLDFTILPPEESQFPDLVIENELFNSSDTNSTISIMDLSTSTDITPAPDIEWFLPNSPIGLEFIADTTDPVPVPDSDSCFSPPLCEPLSDLPYFEPSELLLLQSDITTTSNNTKELTTGGEDAQFWSLLIENESDYGAS